jgi:hypothetical protein
MKRSKYTLLAAAAVFSISAMAGPVLGDTMAFDPPEGPMRVSDGDSTNKVKILRTPDGTLFAVYGEAQDVDVYGNSLAWDAKGSHTRKPFDIVIKYSLDDGDTWSAPLNIDNTARLSSARGILVQEGPPMLDPVTGAPNLLLDPKSVNYPGDSDKPNVFNVGNQILVTYNSKFCAGGEQRFVVYPELYGITVPFSCQYASRLVWNSTAKAFNTYPAWGSLPYKTDQLTSGIRDAKQDANRGNMYGFVLNWQEDPLGLKLGEAEGPGSGASGANVNNGTDIWYSYIDVLNALGTGVDPAKFVNNAWSAPTRITKNIFANRALSGRDYLTHPDGDYDLGNVGASRPNIGQVDDQVVIAYEETKGTMGWDEGKYIRYHAFGYNAPPIGGEHGCIISDPWENSRRVRFLVQSAKTNEVPLLFIYKQGDFTQGGESDIMLRRAVGGLAPDYLEPRVDYGSCRSSILSGGDPMYDIDLTLHGPAMNFSGTRGIALGDAPGTGQMFESIDTGANYIENALAHRGAMRGSNILIGFSYVPDLAAFQLLNNQEPYSFMVRRSTDGGATWTDAVNLTPMIDAASGYTAKEPRIVPTPGSGPKCALGDPTDCQDSDVLYVAFGMQTNVRHYEEASDVDLYMLMTPDFGVTFTAPEAITAGDALGGMPDEFEDFETQIKLRPDGRASYTVWSGNDGTNHSMFRRGRVLGDSMAIETQGGVQTKLSVMPAEAESDAIIDDAVWNALSAYEPPPAGYDFPYGVLEFTVSNVKLGGSIEVTLTFDEELAAGTEYWKYGATPDDPTPHWFKIPATISGNTLSFTLTDGATGDVDIIVNGKIVDPGAPGMVAAKGKGSGKPPKAEKPPKPPKPVKP